MCRFIRKKRRIYSTNPQRMSLFKDSQWDTVNRTNTAEKSNKPGAFINNHLENLISNDENCCSGSIPVGCKGRTGALVVCGHGCVAELSRQSPHTHHCSTQLGKSRAGGQNKNAYDIVHCTFCMYILLSSVHLNICELHMSIQVSIVGKATNLPSQEQFCHDIQYNAVYLSFIF